MKGPGGREGAGDDAGEGRPEGLQLGWGHGRWVLEGLSWGALGRDSALGVAVCRAQEWGQSGWTLWGWQGPARGSWGRGPAASGCCRCWRWAVDVAWGLLAAAVQGHSTGEGELVPRVGCVGSGIEWRVDGDLVLVVWGCCGKLGSGTPKPKNVEFRELGRLCELLCRCFGERCPCEVGEYKDLWSC